MEPVNAAVSTDLREHPRVQHSTPVKVFLRDTRNGAITEASVEVHCHDLSRSGMRIYASFPIEHKEFVVRFEAPNGSYVVESATVVWGAIQRTEWGFEYGLQFENLLPEDVVELAS